VFVGLGLGDFWRGRQGGVFFVPFGLVKFWYGRRGKSCSGESY
jgi:hypothetical protein